MRRRAVVRPEEFPVYAAPRGELPRMVQVLVNGEISGAKQITIGTFSIPPGGCSMLDTHPEVEEAYYIIQGSGYVVIEHDRYDLSPGAIVHVGAGLKHQSFNTGKEALKFVWFFPRAMTGLRHEVQKWSVVK